MGAHERMARFEWLPVLLIWLAFFAGWHISRNPAWQTNGTLALAAGIVNLAAIASGIALTGLAVYARNHWMPLAAYLAGLALCLTLLTH